MQPPETLPPLPWRLTEDGSLSLYHGATDEAYHNQAGAFQESWQHYVSVCGWESVLAARGCLHLLDPSFGLGYNSFTLLQAVWDANAARPLEAKKSQPWRCEILAIELDGSLAVTWAEILAQSCYAKLAPALKDAIEHNIYYQTIIGFSPLFHKTASNTGLELVLRVFQGDTLSVLPRLSALPLSERPAFDLVFHDMFSPKKVPHLWTPFLFSQYYTLLTKQKEPTGKLLTYSRSRLAKDSLTAAGFTYVLPDSRLGKKKGGLIASCPPSL